MTSNKRHPYLTKEFWKKNRFWDTPMHGNKEEYERIHKRILQSFDKTSKD